MNNSLKGIKNEIASLTKPEEEKLKNYFQNTLDACQGTVSSHEVKIEDYQKEVLFFGESSSNDIAGFFRNWDHFLTSFRTAVKFNVALAKKKQQEEKRIEELKKKETRARERRATKPKIERPTSIPKKSPRKKREKASVVDSILDDDLGNLLEDKSKSGIRDENGVVEQVFKGLKSGDTFSRIRGKRLSKRKPTGTGKQPKVPTASTDARKTLQRQQSTLSINNRTRKKKSVTSIQWG